MSTLAQELEQTCPVSLLERKLVRLRICSNDDLLSLAVARGCRHYAPGVKRDTVDLGQEKLSDEELAVAMISGGRNYDPTLIRSAAQLMRGDGVSAERLLFFAKRERAERVLLHIARAGYAHDPEGLQFWKQIQSGLPGYGQRSEPKLPHWSRFVTMPGWQRGKVVEPQWLVPVS